MTTEQVVRKEHAVQLPEKPETVHETAEPVAVAPLPVQPSPPSQEPSWHQVSSALPPQATDDEPAEHELAEQDWPPSVPVQLWQPVKPTIAEVQRTVPTDAPTAEQL